MPEVFPNNRNWLRGGHLKQKRQLTLKEELKQKVARCKGYKSKKEHPCKNPIYLCSECGNYGCTQSEVNVCTAQGFKNDKCLNCGAIGTRVPVMEEQLAEYIALWQQEVPLVGK